MGLSEDLNNPNLFTDNKPGDYTYTDGPLGKSARGQLTLDAPVSRDSAAQRAVGDEARRTTGNPYGVDDGGHLIGARFGGSTGKENLSAQDRNLNRQDYKNMENEWANLLSDKASNTKVFVNVETYDPGKTDRPDNYQGYYIVERTDENGNTMRTWETFSFNNESRQTMSEINEAADKYGFDDAVDKTAEFHFDEETGELVPNPAYSPNVGKADEKTSEQPQDFGVPQEQTEGKAAQEPEQSSDLQESSYFEQAESDYGVPESTGEQPASVDYGVGEQSASENANEDIGSDYGQDTDGADNSSEGVDNGSDGGGNGGQDMD